LERFRIFDRATSITLGIIQLIADHCPPSSAIMVQLRAQAFSVQHLIYDPLELGWMLRVLQRGDGRIPLAEVAINLDCGSLITIVSHYQQWQIVRWLTTVTDRPQCSNLLPRFIRAIVYYASIFPSDHIVASDLLDSGRFLLYLLTHQDQYYLGIQIRLLREQVHDRSRVYPIICINTAMVPERSVLCPPDTSMTNIAIARLEAGSPILVIYSRLTPGRVWQSLREELAQLPPARSKSARSTVP